MPRKKPMSIFTESVNKQPERDIYKDILNSITLTGTATARVIISPANVSQVIDFNSSLPRIKRSLVSKFRLVLENPVELNGAARCCLCGKVIQFNQTPVWYHLIKYSVNQFAAFVCFDSASPSKPSCKCYRRNV